MAHADTVRDIYQAFGQGDFPGILGRLADDVEWEYGVNSTDVPWLQPRRGKDGVMGFFQSLAAVELTKFQPTRLLEDGPVVVALIEVEAIVKATGRHVVEADEVHIWQFDAAGKVSRFRHRVDTHQWWRAVQS